MYRVALTIVKRPRRHSTIRVARIAAWFSLSLWAAGCTTTPGRGNAKYRIAVRYDIEPLWIGASEAALFNRISADLKRLEELGFDTVVFAHLEDDRRMDVLEIAARRGMDGIVSSRALDRFIQSGRLPQGYGDLNKLIVAEVRAISNQTGFAGLALNHVSLSIDGMERLARVATSLKAQGISCVVIAPGHDASGSWDSYGNVSAGELVDTAKRSPSERSLATYHAELASGGTDGLIVDRFARTPGDLPGLEVIDEHPSAAKRAAVRGLIQRARQWGPKLQGFRRKSINEADSGAMGVSLTAFVRDRRRFVLVCNPLSDRYARGSITLSASIHGEAVRRLVEVPATPDRVVGEIFEAQRGSVAISVDLRPGDAELFEVF